MSLAIGSNPSSRQWRPLDEQPRITDERMRRIYQYYQQVRTEIPRKIHQYYFFIPGKQYYNEHFQRVFKECFIDMRGKEALVEDASRDLIRKFEHIPDICQRSEIELHQYYDEDTGATPTFVNRKIHPAVEQRLRLILDSTKGLQQELLELLLQEGKRLHPKLSAKDVLNPSLKTNDPLDVFATATTDFLFSCLFSNCSQVFKTLLSQLLQLMWLEEQIGFIEIPMIAQTIDTDSFEFNGVDYLLKKTNDDGACALHALLGSPIDGEYRYTGADNVRSVFVERLKEQVAASPRIRTRVTNILISHLNTLDRSSAMLFDTPEGEALRSCYLLLQAHTNEFLRTNKDEECLIWQEQIEKPHIERELLSAAKTNSRYENNSKAEILKQLQEHPGLILSLVDESPGDFLRLLESPVYWKIVNLRSQRQNCMGDLDIGKKVFAMRQLYPHYLEVIQRPEYFFIEKELELAAIIFEKKMVAVHLHQDKIIPITEAVNWEKEEAPIIIYHEGVHYSRCEPKSTDAQLTLYEDAQKEASALRAKDQKKSERLISTTKNELSHLMLAGGVSLYRKDPFVISAQLFSSGANFFGTLFDPFNEKKPTSYAKLVFNAAGSLALGQPQEQVAKALIIDSFVSMTVPQNISIPKNAAMTYLVTIIKSINDDQKKDELMKAFFSGLVSAGGVLVPQKENASFGERFIRIIPTNGGIQGLAQDTLTWAFTKKDSATTPTIEDVTDDTQEEISAREKMDAEIDVFEQERKAAKIQEIKNRATVLKEQLTEIKEQGLEGEWLDQLALEGRSSGGMVVEKDKAIDPMGISFEQSLSLNELLPKIEQTTKQLKEKDEVIRIGKENLINLQAAGNSLLIEAATKALETANVERIIIVQDLGKLQYQLTQKLGECSRVEKPSEISFEPIIEVENLEPIPQPKVEMRDEPRYLELLTIRGQLSSDLITAQVDCGKKYQEYKRARREKEGWKHSTNILKYFGYKLNIPKNLLKTYKEKKQAWEESAKKVTKIENQITSNERAKAEACAPKDTPPSSSIPIIVDTRKDKKNHHLSYVDDYGQKQSLGKYKTKEDAEFISGRFSNLIAERTSSSFECYDALMKAAEQGIPLKDLPIRPHFDMPTMLGNSASKNSDTISAASRGFKSEKKAFVDKVFEIVKEHQLQPINPQGFSKGEIQELSQAIRPRIKDDPKEHGFWFKAARVPGKLYNEANDFLHRFAASGEVHVITAAAPENKGSPIAPSQGSLFQHDLGTPASGDSQYWATVHQAAIDRYHSEQVYNEPPKKPSHESTSALQSSTSQPFNPNVPITIPNPFCPGLTKEITPRDSTPKVPSPMKTPMYISPSVIPSPMPHQFIPTEVGGLAPVQTPPLPQPNRPTQTETALVTGNKPKNFGMKILEATLDHFNKKGFIPNGSLIELGPRTQLMFLPTEATAQINRLAGFDPRLQAQYPEAYALAVKVDNFGRREVALFRMSMEEHERSRKKPLQPLVMKVEAIAVASWDAVKETSLQLCHDAAAWGKDLIERWKVDPIKERRNLDLSVLRAIWTLPAFALKVVVRPDQANYDLIDRKCEVIDKGYANLVRIDRDSPSSDIGLFVGEMVAPYACSKLGSVGKRAITAGQRSFNNMQVVSKQIANDFKAWEAASRPSFATAGNVSVPYQETKLFSETVNRSISNGVSGEGAYQVSKSVNMPSWRKVEIRIKHILSGHKQGGWRTGCKNNNKTLFPDGMTEQQIEKSIRQAYKNGKKIGTQGNTIIVKGEYEGMKIKMYVDIEQKAIRTAYPTNY